MSKASSSEDRESFRNEKRQAEYNLRWNNRVASMKKDTGAGMFTNARREWRAAGRNAPLSVASVLTSGYTVKRSETVGRREYC